ncbi:MAG: L,D-transpeptidase catalytic domain protein, partial [Pseudomonadota bacterium]
MKNKAVSVGYNETRSAGPLSAIRVRPAAGNPRRGWLTAGALTIPVALGRGGILANKREGDGGTPRG